MPPLWREGLLGLEAAGLVRSPVWRGADVHRGEGRPVLLIPGFLAGDGSLGVMTRWLRTMGYRTRKAGIRANVDCSAAITDALEERLERMAALTGERVAIIGQSRGGTVARVLAVRRPELVAGILTLGAPSQSMLRVHPAVLAGVGLVGALGTLRVPGFFSAGCLRGHCCSDFRRCLACEFPEDVGYVCVFSKTDGIVDWRSCLDAAARELVEIKSSHCGMAVNAAVYRVAADALAGFWATPDTGDADGWAVAA